MPLILTQKTFTAPRGPNRRSAIPLPLKTGVCHASKPSTGTVVATPIKKSHPSVRQKHSTSRHTDAEVPFLELIPFGQQPTVNFGDVNVGQTQIKYVVIRNIEQVQKQVFVKSFPKAEKGFDIDATEFLLPPMTELLIRLAWTPSTVAAVRETVTLQDVDRMSSRIIILGRSSNPEVRQPTRTHRFPPRLAAQRKNITPRASPSKLGPKLPLTRLSFPSKRRQSSQIVSMINRPQELAKAALVLQSHWRRRAAMRAFSRCVKAAILIQRHFRNILASRKREAATIIIQRHFRKILSQRQREAAAVVLQKYFRRHAVQRKLILLKTQQLAAAVIIQKNVRRYLAQKRLHQLKMQRQIAATVIQKHFRKVLALRRQQDAVVVLQKYYRRYAARRELLRLKSQQVTAAVILQKHVRRYLAQKILLQLKTRRHEAASVIQKHFREVLARRRQHAAAIVLQKYYRRYVARCEILRLKSEQQAAAVVLQKHVRRYLAQKILLQLKRRRQNAATVIQKHFRRWLAQRKLEHLRSRRAALEKFVLFVQPYCRGFLYRNQLERSIKALRQLQTSIYGRE